MINADAQEQLSLDLKEIFKRLKDLETNPFTLTGGAVPAAGTQYNHLEDDGAAWTSVTNLTLPDNAHIGLPGPGGRFVFDLTPAPDQVKITDADLNFVTAAHGIIHVDGVSAGPPRQLLLADGTRYVPGTLAANDLPVHTHSSAADGGSLIIGTTDTDATPGSVLFAGAGGVIQEDNANLFWDDGNNRLGIGIAAPLAKLHVYAGASGVAPHALGDDGAFESGGDVGVSLLTPDANTSYLIWGSPSNSIAVQLRWKSDDNIFTIQAPNQIDMYLAGATDFTFTPNVFTVVSGSTITMADDTTIGAAASALLTFDTSDNEIDVSLAGAVDFVFKANEFSVEAGSFISETGIRATLAAAEALHVPWLAGDAARTAYFGSTNASNNQTAVYADSFSGTGAFGQSNTGVGVYGYSINDDGVFGRTDGTATDNGVWGFANTAGRGVYGSTSSGVGVQGDSATGIAGRFNLTGAGTAILLCEDNGTDVFVVDDGGDVKIGSGVPGGTLDVAGEIRITADDTFAANVAQLYTSPVAGLVLAGHAGTTYDFVIAEATGGQLISNPVGTNNLALVETSGNVGIGTITPGSLTEWDFTTEDLELVDAGSAAATEQDWIEVQVGGVTGYIRVFAAK